MSEVTCAAPGCHNALARPPAKRGRPAIYCCPACRPSAPRRPREARQPLLVEVLQEQGDNGEAGRDWLVRLRRGGHSVVVAHWLGRFGAAAFAAELRPFIDGDGPW